MKKKSNLSEHLRLMRQSDCFELLRLRNLPEIRRFMLDNKEISKDQHLRWFEAVLNSSEPRAYVYEINSECVGFVQFKQTQYCGVLDWGFYLSPAAPKGTGKLLGISAINLIFKESDAHKISGYTFDWNLPAIKFHNSLQFIQEGVMQNHHYDGEKYNSLICFGLQKKEWRIND